MGTCPSAVLPSRRINYLPCPAQIFHSCHQLISIQKGLRDRHHHGSHGLPVTSLPSLFKGAVELWVHSQPAGSGISQWSSGDPAHPHPTAELLFLVASPAFQGSRPHGVPSQGGCHTSACHCGGVGLPHLTWDKGGHEDLPVLQ